MILLFDLGIFYTLWQKNNCVLYSIILLSLLLLLLSFNNHNTGNELILSTVGKILKTLTKKLYVAACVSSII